MEDIFGQFISGQINSEELTQLPEHIWEYLASLTRYSKLKYPLPDSKSASEILAINSRYNDYTILYLSKVDIDLKQLQSLINSCILEDNIELIRYIVSRFNTRLDLDTPCIENLLSIFTLKGDLDIVKVLLENLDPTIYNRIHLAEKAALRGYDHIANYLLSSIDTDTLNSDYQILLTMLRVLARIDDQTKIKHLMSYSSNAPPEITQEMNTIIGGHGVSTPRIRKRR